MKIRTCSINIYVLALFVLFMMMAFSFNPFGESSAEADVYTNKEKIYLKDMSFESPEAPQVFTRDWAPHSDLADRNIAYAVQWFGMAAVAFCFAGILVVRRVRSRSGAERRPEQLDSGPDAPHPPRQAQGSPQADPSKGWRSTIVSLRSGPVEMRSIGTPTSSSSRPR